jgi:hypothetical protein
MVSKGGRGVVIGMFLVIYSRLRLKKLSSNTPARTTAGKLLFFADFLRGTTLMILLLLVRGEAPSNAPRDEALFTRTPSERLDKEPIAALDTAMVILDAAITTGRGKKQARPTPFLSQKPLASQQLSSTKHARTVCGERKRASVRVWICGLSRRM